MPEPSLGLIMIVRNEAHNLGRSLGPVAACFDEVVVADTGSTDGTPELCRGLGARVYEFQWCDHFAAARNFTISKARADWLFWLDADNALAPEMVGELRRRLPKGPAVLWALEQVVPSGERLWQKRCFPRRPEVRFAGRVHEQLVHPPQWPSLPTPLVVRHWGYADPQHAKSKGRYYLKLLNQMLEENPADFYARFQAGRTLANLRDFSKSASHLEQVVASATAREQNPEVWAHSHFLLAQAWERLGRPKQAREVLDAFLAQEPEHGLGHYHRGRLAYALEDWQGAAHHLALARELGLGAPFVDLDPDKTLFWADYFLGRACEHLGRLEEAGAALERAAQRQPHNPAPPTDLARVLMAQGRRAEARARLQQVLDERPGDRPALRLLAQLEEAA